MRRSTGAALAAALLGAPLALLGPGGAHAQCILANPSFEMSGTGGATFAGWSQFGNVGSTTSAAHGSKAARVTSPNTGGWDVSGFWQRQDTSPGEAWQATVQVRHSPTMPLTGQSRAIVNIEWRNASGGLISYESHDVADASTPAGEYQSVSIHSQPAPSGAAAAHYLLGVLQAPGDPVADVSYDQVTFDSLEPPTLDDLQWGDFPGGRTVEFSGRIWRVKGPGYYGPGPSLFCDSSNCIWVDAEGRLHLTIKNFGGLWYSTEAALETPLGYGDYVFTTVGRLDALDPRTVLGLFIWQYGPCYDPANGWWNPYNEVDVEFSRWGAAGNDVGQFVAQPFDHPGNLRRFDAAFAEGERASHAFRWLPDRVEFRSWRGGPAEETPANLIHSWTYTGPHIPRPEQPRVHMNLWQFETHPATNQEVVVERFTFVPPGGALAVLGPSTGAGVPAVFPNPFGARAAILFVMDAGGEARITVHDVSGRLVRAVASRRFAAGPHEVIWDGRDDAGREMASGIYFVSVRSAGVVRTQRVALVR